MPENEWKITSEKNATFANRCSKFLYESYIVNEKWTPNKDNPINLKIKNNTHPLLIDDFTYKCNWIALERNNNIIGVVRYYCDVEKLGFETENFTHLPKIITKKRNLTAEISRVSISSNYKKSPALLILCISLFHLFEKQKIQYSFGSVKNGKILRLYEKLGYNDVTEKNNSISSYLKEKNIVINEKEFKCNRFNLMGTDNIYHILWAENMVHRKKIFLLYQKLKNRYKITTNEF